MLYFFQCYCWFIQFGQSLNRWTSPHLASFLPGPPLHCNQIYCPWPAHNALTAALIGHLLPSRLYTTLLAALACCWKPAQCQRSLYFRLNCPDGEQPDRMSTQSSPGTGLNPEYGKTCSSSWSSHASMLWTQPIKHPRNQ